jgi:hypothetical protein
LDPTFLAYAVAQRPTEVTARRAQWKAHVAQRNAQVVQRAFQAAAERKARRDEVEARRAAIQEAPSFQESQRLRMTWLEGPPASWDTATTPVPVVAAAPSSSAAAAASSSSAPPAPPAPPTKTGKKSKKDKESLKKHVLDIIVTHAFPLNKFEWKAQADCEALPSKKAPYALSRTQLLERIASDPELRALFPSNKSLNAYTKEQLCNTLFRYRPLPSPKN